MSRIYFILLAVLLCGTASGQTGAETDVTTTDSIGDRIKFSTTEAWTYIDDALKQESLWRSESNPLREALRRLLEQSMEPYDTAIHRISSQDFRSIPMHTGDLELVDSVKVKWINDSTLVIDRRGWNTELYIKNVEKLVYPVDLSTLTLSDSLLDADGMLDSTLFIPDTMRVMVIDTAAIRSLGIELHQFTNNRFFPPLTEPGSKRTARLSEDLSHVLYFVPNSSWVADVNSPFHILDGRHHLDSLQWAVNALLNFTERRDSTRLLISDMYGRKTPFWITSGSEEAKRFWVKNYNNDSITLWVGNPGSGQISLLLEDDVNFSRMMKQEIQYLPSLIQEPKRTLQEMKLLEPVPIYWDYSFSSVFSLSQTYLSNWTKGGESSFATMVDITGGATYNNKDAKTQWINIGRLKFGTISTQEKGFRKNHDEFEFDSRFNRNAWGKIGMSSSFYMKHQLAKGYNYLPDSAVVVSKFLNPGTITVGIGAEYKPFEKTTINMAPLSYKTTFVLDTAHIDQTKHGIDADKRAKREFGTQVVINNQFNPAKGLEVTNRVRLFSNYLNKPQNVDVDWEMILEQKINWFFTVRLNLHLIYDDDVHFNVFNADDQPILNPDGSEKKVAKAQLKEFLGLALSIKL